MGTSLGGKVVAVADIGSASAGFAVFRTGRAPQLYAFARESLPFENRSDNALATGVVQALSTACEKALTEYAAQKGPRISSSYCVVGAPWTHSFAGAALGELKREATITDAMISGLAKQALADQKKIDASAMFEANVVRVLLNGYATEEPAGKRAETIRVFTLMSDCDQQVQNGAKEVLGKFLPGTPVIWRSGARAALSVAKRLLGDGSYLIVEVGGEATDLISVRKGILEGRDSIPQGVRQIASSLAKGKPVEETVALLDMIERQQSESDAANELEQAVAKFEPELAHIFGETFAKLSGSRKLPETLVLLAPSQLSRWLSRFFSRIDFTQFTATAQPFAVTSLSAGELLPVAQIPSSFADTGLALGCALVNIESDS